jgi:hypothetical protein
MLGSTARTASANAARFTRGDGADQLMGELASEGGCDLRHQRQSPAGRQTDRRAATWDMEDAYLRARL